MHANESDTPIITHNDNISRGAQRGLFVGTILVGSFLLFLVQPMVARMALPRLGGAPNVWNSAMLVYQALLLAGYAYAHWLGRFTVKRQGMIHLALLAVAGLSLPVELVSLPPIAGMSEALWVPLFLGLSIGPIFFVVSAQAPLMQRWFAAAPGAGQPWALYAASNLGSFGGILAYPLLVEPYLTLQGQSLAWTAGFAVLFVLVAISAFCRRNVVWRQEPSEVVASAEPITWRKTVLWLLLSAVPSAFMLSTTTHLTTDIFAMPLLWVIPLGLYLLSFVFAFADQRGAVTAITRITPVVVLCAGSYAMLSSAAGTLWAVGGTCLLLFCVATALHGKLYDLRPEPNQLTRFYLTMSAGGALGGMFTALIAPLVFDWAWEHPILVLAAAALIPLHPLLTWREEGSVDSQKTRIVLCIVLVIAFLLAWNPFASSFEETAASGLGLVMVSIFLMGLGIMLMYWRWAYVAILLIAMWGQGGSWTIKASLEGLRTRSYFGIYTLRDNIEDQERTLAHGTTLHGKQSLDPKHSRDGLTYYGPGSGVGLALQAVPELQGNAARVGVVGLGTGSLACQAKAGQAWTFFEIDPVILDYSTQGKFTFLQQCTPQAKVVLGDARLEIAQLQPQSFDVLVIDAFTSDAIPMHLLTREAMAVYLRSLTPNGLLVLHISNRYIDLAPVVGSTAQDSGLAAISRIDMPQNNQLYTPSRWIALSRDGKMLDRLAQRTPDSPWVILNEQTEGPWTDNHASILPHVRWGNLLGHL